MAEMSKSRTDQIIDQLVGYDVGLPSQQCKVLQLSTRSRCLPFSSVLSASEGLALNLAVSETAALHYACEWTDHSCYRLCQAGYWVLGHLDLTTSLAAAS